MTLLLLNGWLVSGRIKAIQLEYSEARRTLTNALRKAPQHTAVGFKQTVSVRLRLRSPLSFCCCCCESWLCVHQVHKLLIVVELLLGEIPDRLQFRQPSLKRSLMPYFLLTQGNSLQPLSSCLTPASKDCVMIDMKHLNRIYNLNHHMTFIVLMKSVVCPSYRRLRGRSALDVVQERSEWWIKCVY